ncbi:MAG: nucleoside kinase [Bacteroidales bacterium]|nr:nucleoside kinase [Bacteroidales bacterium]
MLKIYCVNSKTTKEFQEGTTLLEMLPAFEFDRPYPIVSAKVNNVSQGLKFRVYNSRDVEFLDIRRPSAMHVYSRSLCFLLYKASLDLFPGSKLYMEHPISNGFYCRIKKADGQLFDANDLGRLRMQMREIVELDIPFHRHEARIDDAIKMFAELHQMDKVKLLETSGQVYTDYYTLGDVTDYYYGRLLPSTGYLTLWDVEPYHDGLLLRIPDRHRPDRLAERIEQPKTFESFSEGLSWNIIMGLSNVGDVNHACLNGKARELVQVAEALQEKKIVEIAEEIDRRYHGDNPLRLVLITGPSSSGKTTFCKRISIQLLACGLKPISFSTDDYFVNRLDTPKLPDGSYDFDNFDTVDHAALERDLLALLRGEEIEVPEYNFVTGIREYNGKKLQLKQGSVLLLEGIHALNPQLTMQIPERCKFRIFISTLTSTALDDHNWIPTDDTRLLRRIVRDFNKGAFSARQTINQWPNVCEAEEKWINPYKENADVMFNSAYLLEFAVMRNHAERILASVPHNCPEYTEAHRLLRFLHYFIPVPDSEIPATSMLRQFIGGSSFM